MSITAELAESKQEANLGIIDCDIHPYFKTPRDLDAFLPERWRRYVAEYGYLTPGPYASRLTYPRFTPNVCRRDAWPPGGGLPGSDLPFMREQLLDRYNISYGVLEPLLGGNAARNLEAMAALCRATNDWQAQAFVEQEGRLRASILVPQDDAEAAVDEIERRAGDWRFAQIQLASKTTEPLGRRRYWPIFAAAQASGLSRSACTWLARVARRQPVVGRSFTSRNTTWGSTRCRTKLRASFWKACSRRSPGSKWC